MQNALRSNEWRWIWVHKTFKISLENGGPHNSHFLQNWFPTENRSPLFNFYVFQDSEKNTPQSCRIHWNLMNDKKFWFVKVLKLKYRRGDQIIQTFCKICSTLILGPPTLTCRTFKTLRKVLLNHAECVEIQWMTMNLPL